MKKIFTLFAILTMGMWSLSAQTYCEAPASLNAIMHYPSWNNVRLQWDAPANNSQQQLMWSTTTMATRIGLSTGPVNLTGAVRFEASDLSAYTHHSLTAVSFIPGEETSLCQYTIKIWRGGSHGSSYNAGTLVYSKLITEELVVSSLNTIMLDSAVAINHDQELWIGIQCVSNSTEECYPLGASSGGAVVGKGELINLGGSWSTLTQGSLPDYNWIIIGIVTDNDQIVEGYKVYRDNNLLTPTPVVSLDYTDNVANGTYQYDVTAKFRNGCESTPVTATVTMADNPCISCMDSVFVSNGNSENYRLPTSTYYPYSYSQQIYTASEINHINGLINCISFQYFQASPQYRHLKIYLSHTNKSIFSSTTDWLPISAMTLVYDGTLYFHNGGPNYWLNIPLDQPFEWNGSDNLVVTVLDNTGVAGGYVNTFYAHAATNQSLYYQTSTSPLTPESNTYSGTRGTIRSNIRFMIGEPIACPMPTQLQVSEITDNSATASWIPRGGVSSFDVVLVPEGSSLGSEAMQTVTDTIFTMQGLTDNTNYTLYLRGNCGSDYSNWATYSFTTLCLPNSQLPYSTDFEVLGSGNLLPDCWMRETTLNSSAYVNQEADSSNSYLYLYSYSDAPAYAILPSLDAAIDLTTLQLRFKARKTSATYGSLEIGVMSDPRDPSTFTLVKSLDGSMYDGTNQWQEFVTYFNGYTGTGRYIALRAPGYFTNYVHVDDVEVNYIAGCGMPSHFHVVSTTGTVATLAWQTGDLSDASDVYTIEYSEQGLDNWMSVTTTNTQFFLTNLNPLTAYDVRLYVLCDNGTSDTLTAMFNTHCISGGDISIGTGTSTTSYLPSYSFYNYSYTQQVYLASELGGENTFHTIAFDCSGLASTPTRSYQIYLMHTTETGASAGWLPADSAKLVYTGNITWQTGWNTISLDTMFHYDGVRNLALLVLDNTGVYYSGNNFRAHTSTTTSRYVYQDAAAYNPMNVSSTGTSTSSRDNIIFGGICDSVASCVPPVVVVGDVTPHTAQITWAQGYQESSWDLDYQMEGDSTWTSAGVQNGNSYSFNNLFSSNTYRVRMRSLCDFDTSNYTQVSFHTDCEYLDTLPFMEDFDQYASGSTSFPDCWTRLNTSSTPYPYVSGSYSVSGSRSLYLYNGGSSYYAIGMLPRFSNAIAMDSLRITFQTYTTSLSAMMEVGVMENPTDASSFTSLATITPNVISQWEEQEILTRNYHGTGHYVAVRLPMGTSSSFYIDDMAIDYLPECIHVMQLAATEVDSASARIVWTPGRDETDWELIVIPTPADSVDLDTCTVLYPTEPSYLVDMLTPMTDYTAYVRVNCGNTYSEWQSVQFQTTQTPLIAPFVCTFEDTAEHWLFANGTSTNRWYIDTAAHNGGSRGLYISDDNGVTNHYTSSSCYVWAYRDIYLPANPGGYTLSFDWRCVGEGSYDYLTVYFGNPSAPVAGTSLTTPPGTEDLSGRLNQSATFQTFTTTLPGRNTGGVQRLYFMWHNDPSVDNQPPIAVDNVSVSLQTQQQPGCSQPVNIYAYNVTPNSATVIWHETGEATHWNLYYKPSTTTAWTAIMDAPKPCTLTNLSEGTTYDIYVESVCDPVANTTSQPSFANTFTTGVTCPQPVGIVVSNITYNSFVVNWTPAGGETSWTVSYRVNTASTWTDLPVTSHPYTVTGLSGSTTYNVRVKANCSSTEESFWTEYANTIVTPEAPCPVPTNTTVSDITPHTATVTWTQPDNSASSWRVSFRKVGGSWDTVMVSAPTYNMTGLEANSRYMVRIYAICDANSVSSPAVTSFYTTEDTTGIAEYLNQAVTLYPNPTEGSVRIQNKEYMIQTIEVYDAYGKMLNVVKVNDNSAVIDMSDYAAGVYFARIMMSEGVVTKRFVKK